MMDYYSEIHVRMEKYRDRHKNNPRIAALKMVMWNIFFIFYCPKGKKKNKDIVNLQVLDECNLNVGFLLNGGIGDYIVILNYIYKFKQKYNNGNMIIDIFYDKNKKAAETLISSQIPDHRYFMMHDDIYENEIHRKYDIFIDVSRYPNITNRNIDKIRILTPKLIDYFIEIEKFQLTDPRLMDSIPVFDGQSAMIDKICNIKRIQQPDINGILKIKEEYEYPIEIKADEKEYLKKMNLENKKFIIIVSGADVNCGGTESNKLWGNDKYNLLLKKIKEKYPDIVTIQTGTNKNDYRFEYIDRDLVCQTSLEDTIILLKKAYLLVGNEGGMVHLRHAVHGGTSLVLFSSTDEEFFGYSENINIRGTGCPYPCEWLYDNWQTKCDNVNKFACMKSISVNMVMDEIDKYIQGEKSNDKVCS